MEQKFKIGDKVCWKSQARGCTKEKSGEVVYILRPDETPVKVAGRVFPDHTRMFDGLLGTGFPGYSYLVEVSVSERAKKRLYMPRVNNIEKVSHG